MRARFRASSCNCDRPCTNSSAFFSPALFRNDASIKGCTICWIRLKTEPNRGDDEGRVLRQDADDHPDVDLELEAVLGRHEQLAEAEERQPLLALFRQVGIVRLVNYRIRRT